MNKLRLLFVFLILLNNSYSQTKIANIQILDTIDFDGILLTDYSEHRVFLISKEKLKKFDLFSISHKKLIRMEKKGDFLPFLEQLDYISLLKKEGFSPSRNVALTPFEDPASSLISLYSDSIFTEVDVATISFRIVKVEYSTTFLEANLKGFENPTSSEKIILYSQFF